MTDRYAPSKIRVIAICVFRQGDRILVAEGVDRVKQLPFYRPVGGGVDPGERSQDTIRRECQEELGLAVTDLVLLGALENLFTFENKAGHEIVFVYDGVFVDRQVYEQPYLIGEETGGIPFKAMWRSLDSFNQHDRLVPDGLVDLLC
jgi:8-oxo-dGTP pyrophosphatase MutT (NUDIX family)